MSGKREFLCSATYIYSSTLLVRFDGPWIVRFAMRMQDAVVDFSVNVFGIDECTVDVEYAGTNGWELHRHCVSLKLSDMWL
jgi:hypothetical protein